MLIALAQINPIIGAFSYNCDKIIACMDESKNRGAKLVIFPEMAVCGYPPEDLLLMPDFIKETRLSIEKIIKNSHKITAIVGCVRENPYGGEKFLYNSAAIIQEGELIGFQDKSLLPDYDVFSEKRYFEPASTIYVWSLEGLKVAVTICEDIWQHSGAVEYSDYARDPVRELLPAKPDILINLSASPFFINRFETRLAVCEKAAKSLKCPVFFCNQTGGNDSLIFDGNSMVIDKSGELVARAKSFEEDLLFYDLGKHLPKLELKVDFKQELFNALVLGVKDYFSKLGFKKACLGLSGGIDSAVVASIAKEALGAENILALSLSSRFTSPLSQEDARSLAANLEIELKELSIEETFKTLLNTLEPYSFGKSIEVSEENMQARIRGMILMAFSNKYGYIVLGTGNKSEMAMGYATLYGDMCGGLEVIADVTKEQVYALAHYINRDKAIIPDSILNKPPSAELRENQKDTDSLPEYSIVDIVLKDYLEEHLSAESISKKHLLDLFLVKELIFKIHQNEYKRRQAPPGLKVTKKAFTIGRRFPIVQHWRAK